MEEDVIYKNTDPKSGPLDGIQVKTICIRTKFDKLLKRKPYPFKQNETRANVSASVETGTFSIRDLETDVMLAINIETAIEVCAAAVEAYRSLNK